MSSTLLMKCCLLNENYREQAAMPSPLLYSLELQNPVQHFPFVCLLPIFVSLLVLNWLPLSTAPSHEFVITVKVLSVAAVIRNRLPILLCLATCSAHLKTQPQTLIFYSLTFLNFSPSGLRVLELAYTCGANLKSFIH